ncbi:bifunctional 5,10-methylene-tetrahydrofolate dehydrogenase/5,10-methylene-tetrahydrofolate cyclohydrolase [bacterium]|nr:bifunctional 5,10-methylene-tetrahydrofolate dehydrogenase/5,10-methylene-tetrahydrofolate cyclohydrolase [bacterium]
MSAKLIDGKKIAAEVREEVRLGAAELVAKGHAAPGLGVILVGDNPASKAYVGSKTKACKEAGFHSVQIDLPGDVSEAGLLAEVQRLNNDPAIHGILVQLPLPAHISERRVIETISPDKDVDGLTTISAGRLASGIPGFVPCTPLGVQQLLIRSGIKTAGVHAVVVGRSNLVGKPMAQLLVNKGKGGDATVTVCHSRTADLGAVCRQADILVAAIGKAHAITADMIKPGATVIDVGINKLEDPSTPKGYRLTGDVEFDGAAAVAGAITPVPGGVGPMTIAMLLSNTLESAIRRVQG